jgi:CubicO group peptidase (beta-lactamase class C family)
VTVRHLLHHTSGLRDYTTLSEFRTLRHRRLSRDTVLSFVEREPFRFAPGTAMSYSNSGYYLLGQIIEAVSGQSYAAYLQEHVLAAAGMESTFQCDERAVVEDRAHGYSWSKRGFRLRTRGSHHTWSYAAGGLCSNAPDLMAWNQALHGGELLPDSLYKEMTTPGRLADGTTLRYGMGLAVPEDEGRRALGHFGGLAGFTSASLYYPGPDLIVVVLQNTWGLRLAWGLADELVQIALGPGDEPESTPYGDDLSALAGRYAGPTRGGQLRIQSKDGHLLASEAGNDGTPDTLRHGSGRTWRAPGRFRFGADHYRFVRVGQETIELRLDEVSGHYVLRRVGGH